MERKKKIFLADDSLTIQKVIRLALSSDGYQIEAVSDGEDAFRVLSQISSESEAPQFILIDVALPGKTAFEIRSWSVNQPALRHTKFILLCSAFETVDEVQFRALGFAGKLTKPFDPAHLRQMLMSGHGAIPASNATDLKTKNSQPLQPESIPPQFPPSFEATNLGKLNDGEPLPEVNRFSIPSEELPPLDLASDAASLPSHLQTTPPVFGSFELDGGPESDIRALTKETLSGPGMELPPLPSYSSSGTEEDQWTITPPPVPSHLQGASSNFSQAPSNLPPGFPPAPPTSSAPPSWGNIPASPFNEITTDLPSLAPSPTESDGIDEIGERTLNNILRYEPSLPPPPYPRDELPEGSGPLPRVAENASDLNSLPALDSSQVQTLVEKQVQEIVERVARRVLPDVAERVIKEEINKLLGEGPGG